jgi:hypothetical protein
LRGGGRWREDRVYEDAGANHDSGYTEEDDGNDEPHNAPFE